MPEVNEDADADCRIRDVECGPYVIADVEQEEIDDVLVDEAVDKVANYAPAKEAETHLNDHAFQFEVCAKSENRHKSDKSKYREP